VGLLLTIVDRVWRLISVLCVTLGTACRAGREYLWDRQKISLDGYDPAQHDNGQRDAVTEPENKRGTPEGLAEESHKRGEGKRAKQRKYPTFVFGGSTVAGTSPWQS
jgi:hypothetical protein